MRCRDLGTRLLEAELGELDVRARAELSGHLAICARCARVAAADRALGEGLNALRRATPHGVDVRVSVAASIRRSVPSHAHAVHPERALVWAGATAWVLGPLLALGMTRALIEALAKPEALRPTLAAASVILRSLGQVVWDIGGACARAIGALLVPLAEMGIRAEPVALAALTSGVVIMAATIVIVVGRDLRAPFIAGGNS